METAIIITAIVMLFFALLAMWYFIVQLGNLIWLVFEIKDDYDEVS